MNEQEKATGGAFEYVSGTLNAKERKDYEALLTSSEEERELVKFWQEQLLALDKQASEIPPDPGTWQKIIAAIGVAERSSSDKQTNPFRSIWFAWASSAFAAIMLAVVLLKPLLDPQQIHPNTDYIAVLADAEGRPILTALTTAEDNAMWLQWEIEEAGGALAYLGDGDTSLQLWAVSKRDGQVRSLAIFDDKPARKLALDEATFRLVTDASFLLLTREETGGSAIDEPSEELVARGACVRFQEDEA